ncbi:unnamed protein product, partial [Iphiclides podalirius]
MRPGYTLASVHAYSILFCSLTYCTDVLIEDGTGWNGDLVDSRGLSSWQLWKVAGRAGAAEGARWPGARAPGGGAGVVTQCDVSEVSARCAPAPPSVAARSRPPNVAPYAPPPPVHSYRAPVPHHDDIAPSAVRRGERESAHLLSFSVGTRKR